jgi:hypothetical protein
MRMFIARKATHCVSLWFAARSTAPGQFIRVLVCNHAPLRRRAFQPVLRAASPGLTGGGFQLASPQRLMPEAIQRLFVYTYISAP